MIWKFHVCATVVPKHHGKPFTHTGRQILVQTFPYMGLQVVHHTLHRLHWNVNKLVLTRWVPYDGYIRHQKDHLSGRMTDISVMGEWQVAGVRGTRPLRNVWGEALKGRFSFEARKYLFSFQSYVHFEEFFCFPRFCRIWRQTFKLWSFWFRRCLGAFFENSALSPGIFCEPWIWPRDFFWKFPLLFKAEPVSLAWQLWWSPGWAKHFRDGTSKTRMKTRLPDVGEIERRRIVDHRRDRYESLAVIHGPKEKKKHSEVRVWLREVSALCRSQNQRVLGACFGDPMSLPFCTSLFSFTLTHSCRSVRLQRGWERRGAAIRDTSGVGHRSVTNLSAPIWFHWTAAWHRFSSRDAIIVVDSV